MFLDFGLVLNAVLVVIGVLWCREMLGRWRKDAADYKAATDASTRQVILVLWGITAVVVLLLVNFFVGILKNVGVL